MAIYRSASALPPPRGATLLGVRGPDPLPELSLAALLAVVAFAAHLPTPGQWPTLLLDLLAAGVVFAGARFPRRAAASLVAVLVVYAIVPPTGSPVGQLAPLITVFTLGVRRLPTSRDTFTLATAVVLGLDAAVPPIAPGGTLTTWIFWLVTLGIAWFAGEAVGQVHIETPEPEPQTLRAEIARDLHDTVAHDLLMVNWRARDAHIRGHATTEDLDYLCTMASTCETDLRQVLMRLRDGQPGPVRGHPGHPSREGVATKQEVVETLDQAAKRLSEHGFAPQVTVEGDAAGICQQTVDAIQGILTEAVNNVVKHGVPGGRCTVLLGIDEGDVDLVVMNDHLGGDSVAPHPPGRLGLQGMADRAEHAGGTIHAGPTDNLWVVRASFPVSHRYAANETRGLLG